MKFSRRSVQTNACKLLKKLGVGDFQTSYERLTIVETPRGCVPLYVGEEHKRFDVPLKYLSLPAFQELIKQSEDVDLDFKIDGPINIGCTTETFHQLLKQAKKH